MDMHFSTPQNTSTPTLRDIYVNGVWAGHKPGQNLVTLLDFENMFEFLTRATVYYVTKVQGVAINKFKGPACTAVLRTIETCIKPCVVASVVGHLDRDALADAVVLRACGNDAWTVAWNEFLAGLIFNGPYAPIDVKCDEENNTPEDVEQGKMNVGVVVPIEHVELDFVIAPGVGDNQPVPCDPPKPKPVVAKKVPSVDAATGKLIGPPGPGWWIGNDFCWHPPVGKMEKGCDLTEAQAEKLAIGLVTHGEATIDKATGELMDPKVKGVYPVFSPSVPVHEAACMPTCLDNVAKGFNAGYVWHDASTGKLYVCTNASLGYACWHLMTDADGTPLSLGPTQPKKILTPAGPKQVVGGPVDVTYTNESEQPDLQKLFSPEAEKDLVQAMSDQIKKDVQEEMEKQIMSGDVLAKDKLVMAPIIPQAITVSMSNVVAAQEAFDEAVNISSHLMAKCENTK